MVQTLFVHDINNHNKNHSGTDCRLSSRNEAVVVVVSSDGIQERFDDSSNGLVQTSFVSVL